MGTLNNTNNNFNCISGKEAAKNLGNTSLFSVTEVCPNLLLCGASMLTDMRVSELDVGCIISACPELPGIPLPDSVKRQYRVDLTDTVDSDLSQHLDRVADLINQTDIEGGKTLVHCLAGVSRSASLCIGYLIKYKALSLYEAFHHLRASRPCVRPNNGFFTQLIDYEKQIRGVSSVEMVYNAGARAVIPDVLVQDYCNTTRYHTRSRAHGTK